MDCTQDGTYTEHDVNINSMILKFITINFGSCAHGAKLFLNNLIHNGYATVVFNQSMAFGMTDEETKNMKIGYENYLANRTLFVLTDIEKKYVFASANGMSEYDDIYHITPKEKSHKMEPFTRIDIHTFNDTYDHTKSEPQYFIVNFCKSFIDHPILKKIKPGQILLEWIDRTIPHTLYLTPISGRSGGIDFCLANTNDKDNFVSINNQLIRNVYMQYGFVETSVYDMRICKNNTVYYVPVYYKPKNIQRGGYSGTYYNMYVHDKQTYRHMSRHYTQSVR